MCWRKQVIVVDDDRLSVAWAAALRPGKPPVIFVRRSDLGLLQQNCGKGAENCPIMRAIYASAEGLLTTRT